MIGLLGSITGGTGGTTGTYGGVTLTGSISGQANATANITVAGGAVTAVSILNPGSQYVAGDVLTATPSTIGNVSGFSVPVSSVTINQSLAGGTVGYYIPATNTFKQTYQDAGQTRLNTNPVTLDANGCAIVYGTGTYRQLLKDSLGNTIWDQLTTALAVGNNTFWAGQAAGTANAITVTDSSFTGQDGSIINFIPLLTNTSATTINPSGFGNVPIVKDTTTGPVALTGGEIVNSGIGNIVSLQYSATQMDFHLLNTVIQAASGLTSPLCGTVGLKMVNGASNSTITITARQAVMQTAAGLTIKRSSISTTVNITLGTATPTAGGMDGESPGTTTFVDLFLIDNGTMTSALGSASAGNGLTPSLPSGYTYFCYVGGFKVNGSGNLIGQISLGARSQYVVGGANISNLPLLAQGSSGSISVPTWTALGLTNFIPPTATTVGMVLYSGPNSAAGTMLAPNNSYGALTSTSNPPPCVSLQNNASVMNINQICELALESLQIFYASNVASSGAALLYWKDAVNAN